MTNRLLLFYPPSGAPAWVPGGALWAVDFADEDRAFVSGVELPAAEDAIHSFSRSGAGTYLDASGDYQTFADGVIRRGDKGVLIESSDTRLSRYPRTPLTNWVNTNLQSKTAYAGTFCGIFSDSAVLASNGGNFHHAEVDTGFPMTGPTAFAFIVQPGTSGDFRTFVRNVTTSLTTSVVGPFGSASVGNQSAGNIVDILETQIKPGIWLIEAVYEPASPGPSFALRMGPNSSVAGQTLIVHGAWVKTSLQRSSPIIANGTTQGVTRGADVCVLSVPSGTYDVTVKFFDDTTQTLPGEVVSGDQYTIPNSLNGRYIKSIWGA